MVRRLDLSRWRRRDHFLFFREFENPFFNVCVKLDVSRLTELVADEGRSFFLSSLYLSLKAANAVEALKLRIRGDEVVEHDVVHGGSTVLREDETFGFGYFDYTAHYDAFERAGREILAAARGSSDLGLADGRDDLIFYSVLPWISFSSFSHARRSPAVDSNPRVVFGKRNGAAGGDCRLPVSVEVHHALADGLDVARFLEAFEALLAEPEATLNCGPDGT